MNPNDIAPGEDVVRELDAALREFEPLLRDLIKERTEPVADRMKDHVRIVELAGLRKLQAAIEAAKAV